MRLLSILTALIFLSVVYIWISSTGPELAKDDLPSSVAGAVDPSEEVASTPLETESQGSPVAKEALPKAAAPEAQDPLQAKSRVLVQNEQWEEAREAAQACVKKNPQSQSCHEDLVATVFTLGTPEEQEQAVQNCLAATPSSVVCKNDLAVVRMDQGDFAAAVQLYEQLLRENNGRLPSQLLDWQYANALEGAGKLAEAKVLFDRACEAKYTGACERAEELEQELNEI